MGQGHPALPRGPGSPPRALWGSRSLVGQPGPPLAPWWWSPGTRHAQHSASEKRALSCLPISATAAASWERLPLGKCRASHKLRIMAVGLAFEAKKLRWLEGDRGTTSGHRDVSTSSYQPRASLTLCSIPLPGSHSIPAFIRRCRMRPEAPVPIHHTTSSPALSSACVTCRG